MKCQSCSGKLEGNLSICPYCGVRQEVDLKSVHFRDLGANESMPCPHCAIPLDVIEIELDQPVQIEKCNQCLGMFFNPGELEALLEAKTSPMIWLDKEQLDRLGEEKWTQRHDRTYHPCPICHDRMHHVNFGGRSGVILDQCGAHGVWLEGGELRQLKEWWRAGGKFVHQQHEAERAQALFGNGPRPTPETASSARPHFDPDYQPGEYRESRRKDGGGYRGRDLDFDGLEFAFDLVKGLAKLFR